MSQYRCVEGKLWNQLTVCSYLFFRCCTDPRHWNLPLTMMAILVQRASHSSMLTTHTNTENTTISIYIPLKSHLTANISAFCGFMCSTDGLVFFFFFLQWTQPCFGILVLFVLTCEKWVQLLFLLLWCWGYSSTKIFWLLGPSQWLAHPDDRWIKIKKTLRELKIKHSLKEWLSPALNAKFNNIMVLFWSRD